MSASAATASPALRFSSAAPPLAPLHWPLRRWLPSVRCSLAAAPGVRTPPELVDSILSKVKGTDRGVLLPKDGHQEVADVALQLGKYCIDEPVKSPLIFGEWEVVYCSVPTSPGGLYRTPLGRLIFKTDEMIQVVRMWGPAPPKQGPWRARPFSSSWQEIQILGTICESNTYAFVNGWKEEVSRDTASC
ncbi:unnamed protein product [Urochloa humidicola]